MTNQTKLIFAVIVTAACLLATQVQTAAQDKDFKDGEKVEFKMRQSDPWEEGVIVVKMIGDYKQVLVRDKNGNQTGIGSLTVRRIGDRPATTPPVKTNEDVIANETKVDRTKPKTVNANGKGLMTKQEIFDFLRTRLPKAPNDPNAEEVSRALIEEIKRRGVEYFKVEFNDINNKFVRYSPDHDIISVIEHNYGAPPSQSWLLGTWNLMVADTGYNYSIGAKAGFLTINKNGTYQWKPGPNDRVINGKWREATAEEMWIQGGAGIVLLNGEGGSDWIARKSVNRSFKGDHIDVALLDMLLRGGKRRTGARR